MEVIDMNSIKLLNFKNKSSWLGVFMGWVNLKKTVKST